MYILHQNCDPKLAEDKSLPYTAYIVKYFVNEQFNYDIVITDKQVEMFDYYWDRYREGLTSFKQTEGRINPRLWNDNKKQPNKKR